MSQDDQRNQPNEEPAEAARRAEAAAAGEAGRRAEAEAAAREAERRAQAEADLEAGPAAGLRAAQESRASSGAPTVAAEDTREATSPVQAGVMAGAATAAVRAVRRREFHEPGEGAPRYADTAEEAPRSGSEQSWSAQPHPGYQPDPALHYTAKRLVAGALLGALVLAGFTVYGVRLLVGKAGNGNGSAPWTAAVEHNGAVVGGINAQNNGAAPAVALPAGTTYGNSGVANAAAINKAVASCRTARATTVPVTAVIGTSAAIGAWAADATPAVQKLRSDAAALQAAVGTGNVAGVAAAADSLCSSYQAIGALPPMPDAVGSQAWAAAVSAFVNAATQSVRGVSGTIAGKPEAYDLLATGNKELDALAARIAGAS